MRSIDSTVVAKQVSRSEWNTRNFPHQITLERRDRTLRGGEKESLHDCSSSDTQAHHNSNSSSHSREIMCTRMSRKTNKRDFFHHHHHRRHAMASVTEHKANTYPSHPTRRELEVVWHVRRCLSRPITHLSYRCMLFLSCFVLSIQLDSTRCRVFLTCK